MLKIINFAQIIVSLLIITTILLQNKGSGVGAVFGGGGGVAHTRRGADKWLFYSTIVLGALFVLLGIASLIVQNTP